MVKMLGEVKFNENNRWLIAKRTSIFDWQDKQELGR
jgi:hypothetical protein